MQPGSSSLTHVYFLQDYKEEQDPSKFKSEKTGRGPLGPDWKVFNSVLLQSCEDCSDSKAANCDFLPFYLQKELANDPSCPHMCAYKLVTVKFPWMGLGGTIESKIHTVTIHSFFQKMWPGLSILTVILCVGGETVVHPLPQTGVLLDGQVD